MTHPEAFDLDGGRVQAAIDRVRQNPGFPKLAGKVDITFDEWSAYQDTQAAASAAGKLTSGEAQIVYRALGASYSHRYGGWASPDLPTQIVVTRLMGELLGIS